jgi:hypothetical protein
MRKYVVPIVALLGIALLTPRSDAASLIIKSRLGVAGHGVSLPVSVTNVGGTTQLWGLDFALNYTAGALTPGTDPGGNGSCFSPQAVGSSTEVPVVVSGTTFVGTVLANPSLYVGIVRGTSAFTTTGATAPTSAIGLLRLAIPAGGVKGTTVALAVPANYNVANTGDGSTTNSRLGATGATSDATAGTAVTAETITVLDSMPGSTVTNAVPLHQVAIGLFPGDISFASGSLVKPDSGDIGKLAAYLVSKTTMTDYQKIASDVSPLNGYTPALYAGTTGISYGDGLINSGDIGQLAAYLVNKAPNFPQPE